MTRSVLEIRDFRLAVTARLLGLVPSAVFGGCMTLASVATALWLAPDLPRFRLD